MEMTGQIIINAPDGYEITKVEIADGKAYASIEKIEEKKDFDWYWEKFYNGLSYNIESQWKLNRWPILMEFYRWFAKELNGDWKPDWKDEKQLKWYIYYDYSWTRENNRYLYGSLLCFDSHFGISFQEEAVQKALKILPKEFLDKLFQI
jgi:hypothetical protein